MWVSMDFCFFTEGADARETEHVDTVTAKLSMTVLVMVETLCGRVWAYAVTGKGSSEQWVIDQMVEDLETVGLKSERIIVKADQEPSITDMQRAVARAHDGYVTAIEQSRVGDSNSNWRVERASQDFNGLTRTLRSALSRKIG